MDLLLPILFASVVIALAMGVLAFAIARFVMPIEGVLHDRLVQLDGEQPPWLLRLAYDLTKGLNDVLRPVAQKMYGDNVSFLSEIRQLLQYAGQPVTEFVVWERLSQQLVFGAVMSGLGVLGGLYWATTHGDSGNALLLDVVFGVALCGLVGTKLPLIKLKRQAKHRQTEIYYSLPDVLDLLVVCMEAGLGMDSAMQRVAREAETTSPEMAYELSRTQSEITAGIPRATAFDHMAERTTVEELQALCRMVVQADRLGASVAQALRVYADDLRTKRRQKAEELAHKAAVKMMFPLVLFVFPALLGVIIGPGLIQMMDMFASK